jgi:two-component system osmolarity sensor histidine kinase EnvZ
VPTDLVVRVKEAAVLRALENLLGNAVRYGKPPIEIVSRIEDDVLTIEVRDAGQGMTADDVPVLMRPFARGNSARSGEGAGLGLAIVDQVARAHGGIVEFEQGPNRFTARLRLIQKNC